MMKVTFELCPGGIDDPETNELLGKLVITNNIVKSIESRGKRGTYDVVIYKKRRVPWKRIKVRDYAREAYHPWELVRQALNRAAEMNGGRI